jgi:hypothetical protein
MKTNESVNIGDKFFTDEGWELEILDDYNEGLWLVWETRPTWVNGKRRTKPKSIVTLGIRSGYYHRG